MAASIRFRGVCNSMLATTLLVGCATGGGSQSPEAGASARTSGYGVARARTSGDEPSDVGMRSEQGSIDQDDAEDTIRQNWSRLTRCYEQGGSARDFASGQVTLRFSLAVDGSPTEVHVLESHLGSFEVERCLTTTAREIRFPRPHGHGRASFEYSLEFRSSGEIPVIDLPEGAAE